MMRAVLIAVAWADIVLCAAEKAVALLLLVLAVVFSVIAIQKRRRR